jgi:hypothetical protein
VTAIAVKGNVTYAGWCGPSGCNPLQSSTTGGGFVRGIATNAGSTWHELDMSQLPNRLVNAVTVDRANAAHVYAVFGGFSRRWIPNAGVGHVFESTNSGATWTDLGGNLPDAPSRRPRDRRLEAHPRDERRRVRRRPGDSELVVAARQRPSERGAQRPVHEPSGSYVVAVTHGRGLRKITTP